MILTGAVAALVGSLVHARITTPARAPLQAAASVSALMRHHIEPHANAVFDSVGIVVTAGGEAERAPATEEEWEALRRRTVLLAEAANLLFVQHRPVVEADDERRHLHRMVWRDPHTWNRHVGWLVEASGWALEAVERRNIVRLQSHTGDISLACELCHLRYRYPEAIGRLDLPER
jgi:hypothetical protein